MPAWIDASSSEAAYWPSKESKTYDGTMALPLTALTRSLRTTTPAKCWLIFLSSAVCSGVPLVASSSARAIERSSWDTGRSLYSVISVPSEVEVRDKGALERVHRLGVDPPLVGVGY